MRWLFVPLAALPPQPLKQNSDRTRPNQIPQRETTLLTPKMRALTPAEVLFDGEAPPTVLPACDHYAGSEKLMLKSLALQQELGPVFDITLDCEDGAQVG